MPLRPLATPAPAHRVVLVNGDPSVLRLLDTVLSGGHYDMVFVPPDGRAYEQIRSIQPDLVILRTEMREAADLEVLTMLKLDPATRHIPVVTIAADEDEETDADIEELAPPPDDWAEAALPLRLN